MKLKSYTNKDRYGNMTSFEFYEGASIDMGDVPPMMQGIPDHPGNPKGTDTVPAWLTPGEFVMNAEATRMFEPQIEQMNNAGRAVQAQQGGTIPEYAAHGKPIYAAAGGNSGFLANILKRLEGVKSEAYLDSAGKATIGAGSTRGVQMGDTASDDQVDSMLAEDIAVVDQDYGQLVSADLNTNQEAAVKSLLFNIGGPQFANSKARAALNAGDFDSFKKEAAEFRKVGDEVIPGLENRRAQELALFDSPVGQDPWGISRRQVSTRDNRVNKLIAAGQPTDLAMQAAILGQDAETTGEIVTPPPVDRGPPSDMSMISGEDQDAFQRDVEAAQKATREQGMYDPDGNMEAIQAGIDQAQILEDQRRMQQGQVPSMTTPPPMDLEGGVADGVPPVDDRGALQKFGESGGLMGFLDRNIVQPYEEGQERKRILSDQDRMQQGQTGKPPTPDMTVGELFSAASDIDPYTGEPKVDASQDNTYRGVGIPQNRADADALAEEVDSTALKDAQEKSDKANSELEKATKELEAKQANGTATIDDVNSHKSVAAKADVADSNLESTIKSNEAGAANRKAALNEENNTVSSYDPKNPSVPKTGELVKDDQTEALDPAVPTIEGVPPKEFDGDEIILPKDTPVSDSDSVEVAKAIIADNENLPDDKTTDGQTPEAATKAGKTAPPEQISKAESFLSGIFGDLFDKGELKRMAIMYVGGRMLGGSHNGSLNFAAKQYVNRVDKKVETKKAEEKALAKEKRLDLKAARKEFNKNVFKLETERNFSPKSIKAWKDSYDPETGTADSSLLTPIVKPSPMNIEGPPQLYYPEDGGKPRLGIEVKVGNKETGTTTMIVDPKTREQIPTYMYHQDRSRVKGTDEYKAAYQKDSAIYTTMLDDLMAKQFKPGNKKDGTVDYRPTDITASVSGPNIAKWQRDRGVDPSLMPQILESAYANMVASGQKRTADEGKSVKHKNIEKFLDGAYMPALIGDSSIFNVPGTDKPADFKKLSELTNSLVRQARANPKLNIKPTAKDHEVAKHVYTQLKNEFLTGSYKVPDPDPDNPNKTKMQNIWTDEESKANFFEEARKANKSAFELFIEQKQNAYNRKPV